MVLVILTPGIFKRERNWVTHTEVKYAIDMGKPVQLLSKGFDLDTKLTAPGRCGHLKECCEGVAEDFQPYARALIRALEVGVWASQGDDRQAKLRQITRKYLQRSAAATKLAAALLDEAAIGPCGSASVQPLGVSSDASSSRSTSPEPEVEAQAETPIRQWLVGHRIKGDISDTLDNLGVDFAEDLLDLEAADVAQIAAQLEGAQTKRFLRAVEALRL